MIAEDNSSYLNQPAPDIQSNMNSQDIPKASDIPTGSPLECHICYEESSEPVTTVCGHIFCWSCIYKWISAKPTNNYCPMCKNVVTADKLIPLYPKNYIQEKQNSVLQDGVPKRPRAPREEVNPRGRRVFGGAFEGVNINMPNFTMSIGCLPTLLPLVLILMLNFFALFFDNDDDYSTSDTSDDVVIRRSSSHDSYQNNDFYESDIFDWTAILIMIAFISLPFILARLRRR